MTIFEGKGRPMTRMNVTFSVSNGVPNTVFKFFPQKHPCRLNESQKTDFGATFSPSAVLFYWLFPKSCIFSNSINGMWQITLRRYSIRHYLKTDFWVIRRVFSQPDTCRHKKPFKNETFCSVFLDTNLKLCNTGLKQQTYP